MNNFIEKLGSYQIITNLLPGVFFGMALRLLLGIVVPMENIGEEIMVYYFMGLIINRISSLVVKPILKKCRFIQEVPYSDYAKAAKVDSKIDVLSEANNYFRTLLTSCLLLIVIAILQISICNIKWFSLNWKWLLLILLSLLFLFAYKKQTKFICKRIEVVKSFKNDN